jgi:dienelactone hydrolase
MNSMSRLAVTSGVARAPRLLCGWAIAATLIAGCQQTSRPVMSESAPNAAHQPGYTAEQHYATSSIHEAWLLGGETVEITLLRPPGRGPFPLIIYLPGLGEPSSGGAAWRNAWAQAGYAVLSYQPAANGESIWSSARARRGEFTDIAKEKFSQGALAKRLALLRDLLEELDHRHDSGELSGVDTSRIALAGFELGAQTVMTAAGETGYGIEPFALAPTVKCIIAFSPYADFAGAGFEQRFATIHMPVLSVTSMDDGDPYGLITSPAIRRAPFDHMPPGQKYLLSLANAPHSLISGKETPGAENSAQESDDSPRNNTGDGTKQGSGSGRRRGGGGSQGNRKAGGGDTGGANSTSSRSVSSAAWTAELGQAQSVTTAYLDSNLKSDVVASEWLTKDARRFLGNQADLIVK